MPDLTHLGRSKVHPDHAPLCQLLNVLTPIKPCSASCTFRLGQYPEVVRLPGPSQASHSCGKRPVAGCRRLHVHGGVRTNSRTPLTCPFDIHVPLLHACTCVEHATRIRKLLWTSGPEGLVTLSQSMPWQHPHSFVSASFLQQAHHACPSRTAKALPYCPRPHPRSSTVFPLNSWAIQSHTSPSWCNRHGGVGIRHQQSRVSGQHAALRMPRESLSPSRKAERSGDACAHTPSIRCRRRPLLSLPTCRSHLHM